MRQKLKKEVEKKPLMKFKNRSSQDEQSFIAASSNFSLCQPDNQFILKFFRNKSEQSHHIPRVTQVNFDYVIPKKKIQFSSEKNEQNGGKNMKVQIQQIQSSIPKLLKCTNQFFPFFYVETFKKDIQSTEKKNLSIASKGKSDWEFQKQSKHIIMCDKKYLKKQEQLLKDPEIKKNFCHICHIQIKDYQLHIKKEQHRKNARESPYNRYIKDYVRYYASTRQTNKVSQVIALDDDEEEHEIGQQLFEQFQNVKLKMSRKQMPKYLARKLTKAQQKMKKQYQEVSFLTPNSDDNQKKNIPKNNEIKIKQSQICQSQKFSFGRFSQTETKTGSQGREFVDKEEEGKINVSKCLIDKKSVIVLDLF